MGQGLHLVVLEVTGRCNLSCSYCYRGDATQSDLNDPSRVLDQLTETKPYFVNISGGEPLLLKDIFVFAEDLKRYVKASFNYKWDVSAAVPERSV